MEGYVYILHCEGQIHKWFLGDTEFSWRGLLEWTAGLWKTIPFVELNDPYMRGS